jgi:hypothetical protein
MFIEIESDDRATIERVVMASLWHTEPVRVTASGAPGRYRVSLSTMGEEPEIVST